MPRSSMPVRTAPIGHGRTSRRAVPQTITRWRDTGPSSDIRAVVLERDDWSCTWCGQPLNTSRDYSLQHRRARGSGGSRREDTNSPANLLSVHGSATTECHGYIEGHPLEAKARGFRLDQGIDPLLEPVMIASLGGGASLFLTDDGRYSTAPPEVPDGA